MKRILYTLIALCTVGLLSCRKSSDNITIKQYDADQIQLYKNNNGLGDMKKDTVGGDTSGIYYQIISDGKGDVIKYGDVVSYVYTAKTFDGKYSSTDTILNHSNTYAGYISPNGLQLAIKNVAKTYGTKIRVLIPSRLMYGINGTSLPAYNAANTLIYSTIAGNQCFDYTISVMNTNTTTAGVTVSKQAAYDDLSIVKYLAVKGLTNQYTKIDTGKYAGLWYRVLQAGDAAGATITDDSVVGIDYTGTLFDGAIFDQANNADGVASTYFEGLYGVYPGVRGALLLKLPTASKITSGAKLSLIMPSRLGAGRSAVNNPQGFSLPAFSCLRFEFNIVTVTN